MKSSQHNGNKPKHNKIITTQQKQATTQRKQAATRLAAIDCVGGDTGVKPQHRLRHLHTAAPSLTVI